MIYESSSIHKKTPTVHNLSSSLKYLNNDKKKRVEKSQQIRKISEARHTALLPTLVSIFAQERFLTSFNLQIALRRCELSVKSISQLIIRCLDKDERI